MLKSFCNLPFSRLKIDADGSFQSCCHQSTRYGNFITEDLTIADAFNSPLLKEVRKSVLNKDLHESCNNKNCPFYFKEKDNSILTELLKYPSDIEIALPSTWCNIGGLTPTPDTACIMCPRSSNTYMKANSGDNTEKILEFIKPAIPYLKIFSVLGIAEPFYKGRLFDIFNKINYKKYKDNIWFWTFSNGTLLSPEYSKKLIYEYTDKHSIGFSLDAASSSTYEKIRRVKSYKTAIKNVERYFNEVNNFSIKKHYSYTTYNINLLNLDEMEEMVKFSYNVGATKIQFNPTYLPVSDIKIDKNLIINKDNWNLFWEKQQRVEQLAGELGIPVEFYRPFHGGYLK